MTSIQDQNTPVWYISETIHLFHFCPTKFSLMSTSLAGLLRSSALVLRVCSDLRWQVKAKFVKERLGVSQLKKRLLQASSQVVLFQATLDFWPLGTEGRWTQ